MHYQTSSISSCKENRNSITVPVKHKVFKYYSSIARFLGEQKWVDMFDILSKGQFNKNIKFDGKFLIHKSKNGKEERFQVFCNSSMNVDKDLNYDIDGYNACKNFIECNTLYFLNNEQLVNKPPPGIDFYEIVPENETTSGITQSINIRIILIREFVKRKCKEFCIESYFEECVSSILYHLSSKDISTKNFHLINGYIDYIDGLVFCNCGYSFNFKSKNLFITNDLSYTEYDKIGTT